MPIYVPVFPVTTPVVFPGAHIRLRSESPEAGSAAKESSKNRQGVVFVSQGKISNGELRMQLIGTLARIHDIEEKKGTVVSIAIHSLVRARATPAETFSFEKQFYITQIEILEEVCTAPLIAVSHNADLPNFQRFTHLVQDKSSKDALRHALSSDVNQILVGKKLSHDSRIEINDISELGIVANVIQAVTLPDKSIRIIAERICRARLFHLNDGVTAAAVPLSKNADALLDVRLRKFRIDFSRLRLDHDADIAGISRFYDLAGFLDAFTFSSPLETSKKQDLLDTIPIDKRFDLLESYLEQAAAKLDSARNSNKPGTIETEQDDFGREPPGEMDLNELPIGSVVSFAQYCARLVQPLLTRLWPSIPRDYRDSVEFAASLEKDAPETAIRSAISLIEKMTQSVNETIAPSPLEDRIRRIAGAAQHAAYAALCAFVKVQADAVANAASASREVARIDCELIPKIWHYLEQLKKEVPGVARTSGYRSPLEFELASCLFIDKYRKGAMDLSGDGRFPEVASKFYMDCLGSILECYDSEMQLAVKLSGSKRLPTSPLAFCFVNSATFNAKAHLSDRQPTIEVNAAIPAVLFRAFQKAIDGQEVFPETGGEDRIYLGGRFLKGEHSNRYQSASDIFGLDQDSSIEDNIARSFSLSFASWERVSLASVLSRLCVTFIGCHEIAHLTQGHCGFCTERLGDSKYCEVISGESKHRRIRRLMEVEADCNAFAMLLRYVYRYKDDYAAILCLNRPREDEEILVKLLFAMRVMFVAWSISEPSSEHQSAIHPNPMERLFCVELAAERFFEQTGNALNINWRAVMERVDVQFTASVKHLFLHLPDHVPGNARKFHKHSISLLRSLWRYRQIWAEHGWYKPVPITPPSSEAGRF